MTSIQALVLYGIVFFIILHIVQFAHCTCALRSHDFHPFTKIDFIKYLFSIFSFVDGTIIVYIDYYVFISFVCLYKNINKKHVQIVLKFEHFVFFILIRRISEQKVCYINGLSISNKISWQKQMYA